MMTNKYNQDIHHRRSIRLTGHDYSQSGLYFITLCTVDRTCMFGNVVEGKMQLNDIGQLVEQEWLNTINIRHNDVRLHNYIVMPNHFHAIIEIRRGESHSPQSHSSQPNSPHSHSPQTINGGNINENDSQQRMKSPSQTVGAIVRGFRSCLNFIKKNTLEFHSLIFGIFEILFNLFLLFFFDNSPLLTAK